MRRWFLSYNTQDLALMQALEAALRQRDTDAHIFFAPRSLRAGGYWLPELAKEIAQSTAFVLLIGKKGIGQWQVIEYYDAFDRRVKEPDYPVILILQSGQSAPGLPFLHQLHRIVTSDPASEDTVGKLFHAADGTDARPGELWRYTAPYRGLAAMTESDSDFFFGRERETVEVICRDTRQASYPAWQFWCRQILAGASWCLGRAPTPGLSRACDERRSLATGVLQ
jgi:TIR domain